MIRCRPSQGAKKAEPGRRWLGFGRRPAVRRCSPPSISLSRVARSSWQKQPGGGGGGRGRRPRSSVSEPFSAAGYHRHRPPFLPLCCLSEPHAALLSLAGPGLFVPYPFVTYSIMGRSYPKQTSSMQSQLSVSTLTFLLLVYATSSPSLSRRGYVYIGVHASATSKNDRPAGRGGHRTLSLRLRARLSLSLSPFMKHDGRIFIGTEKAEKRHGACGNSPQGLSKARFDRAPARSTPPHPDYTVHSTTY